MTRLVDARWGTAETPLPDWRLVEEDERDDDEQIETPADVIAMLGFDPAKDTQAQDHMALDRDSVRSVDGDGHLHVASSVISAAQVNDYLAEEIPYWQALGLKAGQMYALLRDPLELEKAVDTFHGKPLLIVHRGQTAANHDRTVVVGAISNPVWEAPNVKAELTVWDGEAIKAIKSGELSDLSCGYRYRPVMESGTYNGVAYQGRMVDIFANHCSLVSQGRVIGAFVGDSIHGDAWLSIERAILELKEWK